MRTSIGYLAPGAFTFPENPLRNALAGGIGAMVDGQFSFPQNTLALGCGTSCSCGGTCRGGVAGLGSILDSPWLKYAAIGAGVLLLLSMWRGSKSDYERAMTSARDEYQARVRDIRRKYPRVGSRVASKLPF